jgi:hypothetical protein
MSNSPEETKLGGETQPRKFRESYEHLVQWIRSRLIAEKNVNHMLAIARFYGEIRWANFDGVYQDDGVEDAVEARVLQSKRLHLPDLSTKDGGTVIIASTLFDVGGHSRVVLNWMKAFAELKNHRLLITRSITRVFRESLATQDIPYHLCENSGVDLINEILKYCSNAQRVVLHIHPDDIVTSVASRILAKSGKSIIFYNHADHVLSYGISSAQLVCEISSYGIELNRRTKRTKAYCYVGIPIDFPDPKPSLELAAPTKSTKTVLSCGASYKYAPGNAFFGDFVDSLLRARQDVTVLLVGPTGNEHWWDETRACWGARVHFLGNVSHGDYINVMREADVYVDSFPVTGGTAFPEALLNGKPVAGLINPMQGYSPVDELRSANLSDLTDQVVNLLDSDSKRICKIEDVRIRTEAAHSIRAFRERIESAYAGSLGANASSNVSVDTRWLEKSWENSCRYIASHYTSHWFSLPSVFSLSYLGKLHSERNLQESTFMSDAIKHVILALFPHAIRHQMIALRTEQLARTRLG